LAQARPDLRFPPGLQACFDSALARTPVQRYQSVAKFAADLAAVAGVDRAGGVALPPTRADAEGKTQPLVAGPTQRAARPPSPPAASPPRRPGRLVPLALAAAVVIGGGAVALTLLREDGGGVPAGSGTDTSRATATGGSRDVPPTDTAARLPVDRRAQPGTDTARGGPLSRGGGGDAPDRSGINPAAVPALLERLIEMPPQVILDSATAVYGTSGVAQGDRAFAACLIAEAHRAMGARAEALRWGRVGLGLNPGLTSCRALVNDLSGQP
jgi:hypothetical protein